MQRLLDRKVAQFSPLLRLIPTILRNILCTEKCPYMLSSRLWKLLMDLLHSSVLRLFSRPCLKQHQRYSHQTHHRLQMVRVPVLQRTHNPTIHFQPQIVPLQRRRQKKIGNYPARLSIHTTSLASSHKVEPLLSKIGMFAMLAMWFMGNNMS
jgi:hypothetical protein